MDRDRDGSLSPNQHGTSWPWVWLAAPGVAAAIASWLVVLDRSFWYDEAYTVTVSDRSIGSIIDLASSTEAVYSIGYYLLVHLWADIWGFSAEALRMFSVVCAVASVPVVIATTRRLHDSGTAALAGLLLAVSPFFAHYSTEARQYGLLLLTTSAAIYIFTRLCRDAFRPVWVAAYVANGIVLTTTHWYGVFVLLANAAAALVVRAPDRQIPLRILALASTVAIAPAATMGALNRQNAGPFHGVTWIERLTWDGFTHTTLTLIGAPNVRWALPALIVLAIGLTRADVVTRSWLLVPLGAAYLASIAQPMWVTRYFFIVLPPICVTMAVGVRALPTRLLRFAAGATLIAVSLSGVLAFSRQPPHEEWADLAADLASVDGPVVVGWYNAGPPLDYYAREHPGLESRFLDADDAEQAPEIWFVGTDVELYRAESDTAKRLIERTHDATSTQRFSGHLFITRYVGSVPEPQRSEPVHTRDGSDRLGDATDTEGA